MVDLMQEYFLRIARVTHQYAEVLGRTDANLDDVGLAFQHMNIDIQELIEYVKNVDSVPCVVQVPQFPVRRENHLNFLKPGSREVVTRPVHVHEHLPAMYPDTEEEYVRAEDKNESLVNGTTDVTSSSGTSSSNSNNTSPHRTSPQVVFKRPGDPVSFESPIVKRAKVLEEGRPLREISSVMMTTSGFLSPAREGKLPEARTPHQVRSDSPQPSSYPMVPPELKSDKKPKKVVRKNPEDRKLDKENKKKKGAKELFKPDKIDESKIKKLVGMKELAKLKPLKPGGGKTQSTTLQELTGSRPSTPKIASPKTASPKALAGSPKAPKAAQPKAKADKVIDLTDSSPVADKKEETVDKLPSEPDKQKLNIFKKISKPREEKDKDKETLEPQRYKDLALDSRENSPELIIDIENTEKHASHRNDVDAKGGREEKRTPDVHAQPDGDLADVQSPSSDVYMFDDADISPPGTPSTPKTPELSVPTVAEQKRKKKEKSGKKKEPKVKNAKQCVSPKKTKLANDTAELDILDRPKTPQAPEPPLPREPILPPTLPFPFFPSFPSAPGLIPHPLFHPRFPLPLGRGGAGPHPAMPNVALPPRFLNPPVKPEEFTLPKVKSVEREKQPLVPAASVELTASSIPVENEKVDKEKVDNKLTKVFKPNKELTFMSKVPERMPPAGVAPPIMSAPVAPITLATPTVPAAQMPPAKNPKAEKTEKNDMKSKEHKKEKKDKLKKKKDKKEKHKEKGEKVKEKKEKADKREKLEKLKEKKEKKEKKKEKDSNKKNMKEDKNPETLPKITLKLGTASPRPATPENAPMKKITIKPLVKKPDEEAKREPSPELAKISALVTRPPKQKSASKKTEEGILDGSPALPTDSFSANLTSVPLASAPRAKKSNFQNLSQSELISPPHFDPPKLLNPLVPPQQPPYYFDRGGRQVWICPACGSQDDGSPMIGCDDCDAWYHWVCVGMQVPPADDEDWYCRFCIAKKQELLHDKKKKKRKKKVKVTA
ncbi:Transcription initiation factor TFIID subunit [Ooceraea biroi]|uniref:Transcription initiation factor TFIID subunit n=1 Tax=Ooceraea biroi TaxID=2015173 RepID=A0A026WKF1_OOCBI|nr:Transcription initiation factor TFIID subunit [Ooceraea biroi]